MTTTDLADHQVVRDTTPTPTAEGWSIQLEDGNTFTCEPGDTLLRAALRQGIGFPYECNSGGCGSCMFELRSGAVQEVWDNPPGLSATAREKGRRLACQCVPLSDCTIQVRPRPQYVAPVTPQRCDAVLEEIISLTHDMSLFRLKTMVPAVFLPGQFAMLSMAGQPHARAYSMCNLENDRGHWDFIIKRVPGGSFTNALFDLDPGANIEIDGPYGVAFLREESPRDILCIAGGAGLSPMLSILRGASASPLLQGRELQFFYGGRTPQDFCHEPLFNEDAVLAAKVIHRSAVSAQQDDSQVWEGERGFIHEVVEHHLADRLKSFEIYLSGPPPMTDAVQKMLMIKYRVPGAQIHFDRFY